MPINAIAIAIAIAISIAISIAIAFAIAFAIAISIAIAIAIAISISIAIACYCMTRRNLAGEVLKSNRERSTRKNGTVEELVRLFPSGVCSIEDGEMRASSVIPRTMSEKKDGIKLNLQILTRNRMKETKSQ